MSYEPDPFETREPAAAAEPQLADYGRLLLRHRRAILLCVVAALAAAAAISASTRPLYRATVVLHVEPDRPGPVDIGPASENLPRYDPDFLATQTRLMKSREVAARAAAKLGRPPANAPAAEKTGAALSIQRRVDAAPVRGTNLVELSAAAASPALAAETANAVAESFIDWSLETRILAVRRAGEFLSTQIAQTKRELDETERSLLAYGQEKDIVTTDPASSAALSKLDALNRDYAAAVADRVAKESRFREVERSPAPSLADPESSALLSQLRGDQARLEREYAEKLAVFKPAYPAMQQLKAQIDRGRQSIGAVLAQGASKARGAARTDYQAAQRREDSLKELLESSRREAMAQGRDAAAYENLRVEISTKRALLDALLKRQAETDILSRLGQERLSSMRIVDRALPPSAPFRPSYPRNAAIAVVAGLVVGAAVALGRSAFDRSLRTAEQIEQYLRLPPLGIIPAAGALAAGRVGRYALAPIRRKRLDAGEEISIELLPHNHSRSAVAEAYRSFMAALVLSQPQLKSFVITSALPKEGKTATAVNLAVVLGQLGKRVLLIDADLHRPRLHEVFGVSNAAGLVSVLTENIDVRLAVTVTNVPGVSVLPAGPESDNPSALLVSRAMSRALAVASAEFDYVILDTPPVFPLADLLVFGAQTDGVVLCVQGGRTPREQVARVRDRLLRANMRILGVVINGLAEESDNYAGSGYPELAIGAEPGRLEPPRPS